jgi:thiamine-phosphate pyrophosphorylase
MKKKLPMMVLISSPRMRRGEASDLEEMFDCGLERLHLRKPDHSAKDMAKILDKLPEKYLDRIVIHRMPELLKEYPVAGYHHSSIESIQKTDGTSSRSFHKFSKLRENKEALDYCFFGPVYNSISKHGYGPKVSMVEMRDYFAEDEERKRPPVFALGGIRRNKIRSLLDLGFSGVALLGAVWGKNDPVSAFEGFVKVRDAIIDESEDKSDFREQRTVKEVPPSLESFRK